MKTLNQLSKPEKINFLQKVQSGEVNPRQFKGQPVFLTKKGDSFLSTMQGSFPVAVTITPEAAHDKTEFDQIINEAEKPL